jgi:hypothetical protein
MDHLLRNSFLWAPVPQAGFDSASEKLWTFVFCSAHDKSSVVEIIAAV